MPSARQSRAAHALKREHVLDTATELFAEEGYAPVTMDDLARATGRGRATLYRDFGSPLELFLDAAERSLLEREHPPLIDPDEVWPLPIGVAERIVARHRADERLEQVLGGVAASGVPRAKALMARVRLERRDDAVALTCLFARRLDERVHLAERILEPVNYRHLVLRCGWSERQYARWTASELSRLRRWTVPAP